ncbi:hypothetical protein PFISCL1PPCAC_15966, partial [Pristionchus fissidentatus]
QISSSPMEDLDGSRDGEGERNEESMEYGGRNGSDILDASLLRLRQPSQQPEFILGRRVFPRVNSNLSNSSGRDGMEEEEREANGGHRVSAPFNVRGRLSERNRRERESANLTNRFYDSRDDSDSEYDLWREVRQNDARDILLARRAERNSWNEAEDENEFWRG